MLITDRAKVSSRTVLPNGFLRVDAVMSRVGIQHYSAGELGVTDRPATQVIHVYRPPEEVFAPDSMASLALMPVTDDHPSVMVDSANARRLAVGWTGDRVEKVGNTHVGASAVISDEAAIRKLDQKDELSVGYDCELDWTPGVVPAGVIDAGKTYDAIQRTIRGNHLALVDAGRCGPSCRVQDSAPGPAQDSASKTDCNCQGDAQMAEKALTKRLIDGVGMVEGTDEAFAVIDKLTADLKTANDAKAKLDGETAAAAATHADAIKAKDAEIAKLTAATADGAALDARVNARAKLVSDAKRIGGDTVVTDGKTDLEIQKAVVAAKLGDAAVKDKADTFFASAFDTLVSLNPPGESGSGQQTQQRDGLREGFAPAERRQATDAAASYEARMASRWNDKGAAA